jgi:hypothetical protein
LFLTETQPGSEQQNLQETCGTKNRNAVERDLLDVSLSWAEDKSRQNLNDHLPGYWCSPIPDSRNENVRTTVSSEVSSRPHVIRSRDQNSLQFPLWFEDAVLVNVAASKKAVMYHAQAKQINKYCQHNK